MHRARERTRASEVNALLEHKLKQETREEDAVRPRSYGATVRGYGGQFEIKAMPTVHD